MFYALELRLRLLVRQLVFGALALVCVIVAAVFFTDAALVALAEAYDLLTAMLVVGGGISSWRFCCCSSRAVRGLRFRRPRPQ